MYLSYTPLISKVCQQAMRAAAETVHLPQARPSVPSFGEVLVLGIQAESAPMRSSVLQVENLSSLSDQRATLATRGSITIFLFFDADNFSPENIK